jgi:hypothetical protein
MSGQRRSARARKPDDTRSHHKYLHDPFRPELLLLSQLIKSHELAASTAALQYAVQANSAHPTEKLKAFRQIGATHCVAMTLIMLRRASNHHGIRQLSL